MSASPSGFALRKNGTCGAAEVDCGRTVAPYRACCPESSFCPTQYNVDCCPSSSNCTAELVREPHCANTTWDLYDNGGYFCCEKGLVGYAATTNSNGCAQPGYAFQDGETVLKLISAGEDPATATPDATRSTSGPENPTGTPPDNAPAVSETSLPATSSGPPVAAIAGGTVGGVVALVAAAAMWWFLRRKRRANLPPEEKVKEADVRVAAIPPSELDGETPRKQPGQLPAQHGVSELPG
ncbi:uncharacterized protein DNG_06807 [Cephalotrichum gorgonifer]|uniref:Uncharacterized protein n=1 Tax=Cephalotrichum gorgonifer TaxID=2041049 RepID=A0AAE8SWY5_9PEZI|nr:uncharacterized protein DNG_06807 [Cephalotrichum gorgonifer]